MSYENNNTEEIYHTDGREYREKKITWIDQNDREHEGIAILDVEAKEIRLHEDRRQEWFDSLREEDIDEELKAEGVTLEDIFCDIPDDVTDWHLV